MGSRSQAILNGIKTTKKIANAYLFTNSDNASKLNAAIDFARSLNCSSIKIDAPCGVCTSCRKAVKNINPDIILIEKDKTSIKIDQVRKLKEITRYGPSENPWQIVIINEVDTMTQGSANSFLKILEEPPANVVFILIAEREGTLPMTILSRCQKIIFEEQQVAEPNDEAKKSFSKITAKPFDYIEVSQILSDSKEPKELLKQFFALFAISKKAKEARIVLETIKGLERKVNPKLALDLLCLKLWKKNNNLPS
ncbi:AAA family ATPase [Candidatus Saganbacteria bacterium]|nr:AAA family ATPase [Candidatus Saganbacteria bacterium]